MAATKPDALVLISFEEAKKIIPVLISKGIGPQDIQLYMVDGDTADYSKDFDPGTLKGTKATIPVSPDSSCRNPKCPISPTLDLGRAPDTRPGSASSTSSSCFSCGSRRGRRPSPASPVAGALGPLPAAPQLVQPRPHRRLAQAKSLSDARHHQLPLHRPGLAGQFRGQGDDAQHRIGRPALPSTPSAAPWPSPAAA